MFIIIIIIIIIFNCFSNEMFSPFHRRGIDRENDDNNGDVQVGDGDQSEGNKKLIE